MGLVITLFGFLKQKLIALPFAAILFVLDGSLLFTQGLQYESGAVFDSVTGVVTYTFSTISPSDPGIVLMGVAFVLIGAVLGLMSFKIVKLGGDL